MQIALNMIRSLHFKENEKLSLIQNIMTELEVPLLDLFPERNRQIAEVLCDSMQPVFDLLSFSQNSFVEEKTTDIEERKSKKTKAELQEKPVKLKKDGTPRKPYTRRQKAKEDVLPLPEPEQIKASEEPQPPSEEQIKIVEDNITTEQNASENLNPPPSIAEKAEEDVQKNKRIDGKILYQNPNNSKSLIISNEIIPDLKIWGIVVPYQNRKGVFGVSIFEEKKVMIVKKAMAKAKSFPKFYGNEWEVMNDRHKKSLIAAQTKLNKILEQLHGDLVHGNYLTYPFTGKENATIIRYAIELPDVNLE